MNKLNTIITSLHEKGIATMTLADDTGCLLGESAKRLFETKTIEDPRSACFYALGVTQQLCRPTIILAKGDHLDHLYTGLVEAWFQQMPLVVVVADVNDQTDYGLYHRCLNKVIDLRGDATVPLDISMQGPTLIITEGASPAQKALTLPASKPCCQAMPGCINRKANMARFQNTWATYAAHKAMYIAYCPCRG